MAKERFEPMALGHMLIEMRKRYEVSKYAISRASTRYIPHSMLYRLETGRDLKPDYDTLWHLLQGVEETSERGKVGRAERLAAFENAFVDRITYEAAKFAVYYLHLLSGDGGELHPVLEGLREDILAAHPQEAAHFPSEAGGSTQAEPHAPRSSGTRGPSRERVDLATATGLSAVRAMAEMKEAHAQRLGLLIDVMPYLVMDWEVDRAEIGLGDLAREASLLSGGPATPTAGPPAPDVGRAVQLFARRGDDPPRRPSSHRRPRRSQESD